jgi:hypothetical protein
MNHKTRTAYDEVQRERRTFLQDLTLKQRPRNCDRPVINIPTADTLTCSAQNSDELTINTT